MAEAGRRNIIQGKIPFRGRPERVRAAGKRHTAFRKAEVLLRGVPDVHAQVL